MQALQLLAESSGSIRRAFRENFEDLRKVVEREASEFKGGLRGFQDNMGKKLRLTSGAAVNADIMNEPGPAPASAARSSHASTISSLTSRTRTTTSSLKTAMGMSRVGRPPRVKTTRRKLKRSKFATTRFAYATCMKQLCPKIKLDMFLDEQPPFYVSSGVQAIANNLGVFFTFPSKQFIAQIAYKLAIDLNAWSRGQAYPSMRDDPASGFVPGSGGVGIPVEIMIPTGTDPTLVPGGSVMGNATYNNINPQVSLNLAGEEKFYGTPGVIMKFFKRTYTFMNTTAAVANLTVYEYILKRGCDDTQTSVLSCWSTSMEQDKPHSFVNTLQPSKNTSSLVYPFNNLQSNTLRTPQDLGETPKITYKTLSKNWGLLKVTTYQIQPGQSHEHVVYMPGQYYSVRDYLSNDTNAFVPAKAVSVMFVLNGELAYEGSDNNNPDGRLGTGITSLNFRARSEALFQAIPTNQSYTHMRCHENLISDVLPSYALDNPVTILPAQLQTTIEEHDQFDTPNLDQDGEQNK